MILIGVDTGGTFTDFVFKKGNDWAAYKILSTPDDPARAVLEGLHYIGKGERKQIIHGSTVATNAILERKGAKTALITNKGFEDVIQIGRQNRSRLYDLAYRKDPHIVPSELRFGIKGRVLNNGEEFEPLDSFEIQSVVDAIKVSHVESVAVCLLFSYLNPIHEQKVKEALDTIGVPVSLSHEILPEFREFERTSTTAINAYVLPKMETYLRRIRDDLEEGDTLNILQSNGGSISAASAMKESVKTILSGPAGGTVGACEIGKMSGHTKLITFDMGGTSTDVSLIDGDLSFTMESKISDYPVRVPMIDIHTVGAGGGSIAYLDAGGALKVGPESAGADPGPICYGKHNQITVTDANLYLGRLIPEHFLGGTMKLYPERLEDCFAHMAEEAGASTVELAEGILSVANTTMEKAVRVISVEKGYDPREFVLFSFGGAGGMHVAYLAGLLKIPKVIVPRNPGLLSALGMVMADVLKDYSLTVMGSEHTASFKILSPLFGDLERKGVEDLLAEGIKKNNIFLERYADLRYEGQAYEMIVPFDKNFLDRFHQLHEKTYGYRIDGKAVQIVSIRLRARGKLDKPHFQRASKLSRKIPAHAYLGERNVIFDHKATPTQIIARDKLVSGNRLYGPAVVVEYSSTIVIPPFAKGSVDAYGNIIIELMT